MLCHKFRRRNRRERNAQSLNNIPPLNQICSCAHARRSLTMIRGPVWSLPAGPATGCPESMANWTWAVSLKCLQLERSRVIFSLPPQHLRSHFPRKNTQGRLSARRNDTTAARLAEVGRRWCHCLYAGEPCVWQRERNATEEDGARRAEKNVE